jgi:hypothetical protein
MATMGPVQTDPSRAPEEPGVAVVEDPAVGRDEPVPQTIWRAGHAHDRLVQWVAASRAEEPGVAEVEGPIIGRDQPVPASQSLHLRPA